MRHRKDGFKLGRLTQHRWAMFRNLLVALFRHERITTTEAKAKAVRGLADHMVTLAKRENLHARRQVLITCRADGAFSHAAMRLTDLSEGGCFVATGAEFPRGLRLTLIATIAGRDVTLAGRVALPGADRDQQPPPLQLR